MTVQTSDLTVLVAMLRAGGIVAAPTETLVGLLADARDPDAVARVAALKGRDVSQPIGLLLPDLAALGSVASELPELALRLARRHWPGPLTLILPARAGWPDALSKDGKIGVRVPGPSPALDLVRAFGAPLTATSANLTGEPAAVSGEEALRIFPRGLAAVAPGMAPGGEPSTVLDVSGPEPKLIRAGAIASESLRFSD